MNTVFDIVTLDDWIGVLITANENKISFVKSIIFLLTLIFIGNFIIFNLFITIMLYGFEIIGEIEIKNDENEKYNEIFIQYLNKKEQIKNNKVILNLYILPIK